jgi:hypothetical protein
MSIVLFGIWATFPGYGAWIATVKRRNPGEGIILGLLLGPVGCVLEASLRERTAGEVEQERARFQEEAQARLEGEKRRLAAFQAEVARRRKEARERAEAARVRRAEAYARFAAWFDRAVLKFGWYKGLPEVAQPIVVGLLVALPIVVVMALIFQG